MYLQGHGNHAMTRERSSNLGSPCRGPLSQSFLSTTSAKFGRKRWDPQDWSALPAPHSPHTSHGRAEREKANPSFDTACIALLRAHFRPCLTAAAFIRTQDASSSHRWMNANVTNYLITQEHDGRGANPLSGTTKTNALINNHRWSWRQVHFFDSTSTINHVHPAWDASLH